MITRIISFAIRLHRGFRRRLRNYYYRNAFASCGKHLQVDSDVFITRPDMVSVGNNVTINRGVILQGTQSGRIEIGDNVNFSYSSKIITANLSFPERKHIFKDVIIGNNVWVAANVIILPGVRIGDNVCIAAGAVVTSDLQSGYLYAGVPARQIKSIKK